MITSYYKKHGKNKSHLPNGLEKSHNTIKKDLIFSSLGDAKPPSPFLSANCDTFFIGDIHGRFDVFIQNLYQIGFIDKDGKPKEENRGKTLGLLGDLINVGGPYSKEVLTYVYELQDQAKLNGQNVEIIFGNHDIDFIAMLNCYNKFKASLPPELNFPEEYDFIPERLSFYLGNDAKPEDALMLGEILTQNRQRHTFYYANDALKIEASHSGIEKSVRKEILKKFSGIDTPEFKEAVNNAQTSGQIQTIMDRYGLTYEQIASKLNQDIQNNFEDFINVVSYYYARYRIYELKNTNGDNALIMKYKKLARILLKNISFDALDKYAFLNSNSKYTIDKLVNGKYSGIYFSEKKPRRTLNTKGLRSLENPGIITNPSKYIQICGHMPGVQGDTTKGCKYSKATMEAYAEDKNSLIKRIHSNIYVDTNLMYGNQAILGINSKKQNFYEIFNMKKFSAIPKNRWDPGINPIKANNWRKIKILGPRIPTTASPQIAEGRQTVSLFG